MKDYNKIAGCLLGGAAGDALGYAIEFDDEKTIFSKYGESGIQKFDLDFNSGEAIISDDTQMTGAIAIRQVLLQEIFLARIWGCRLYLRSI